MVLSGRGARARASKPTLTALLDFWGLDWEHARVSAGWRSILCPVHSEDTPSFRFSEEGGYKCLSCGVSGGDSLDLIQAREGCEFEQALAIAAEVPGEVVETQAPARRRGRSSGAGGRRGKLTYRRRE